MKRQFISMVAGAAFILTPLSAFAADAPAADSTLTPGGPAGDLAPTFAIGTTGAIVLGVVAVAALVAVAASSSGGGGNGGGTVTTTTTGP